MASAGRVDEHPPALPVKQHRSPSFRSSSVGSDCDLLSPVGLQHSNYNYNDVFAEPSDCQAAQCPIHQHYDQSRLPVRFFSEGTPPPVPKKKSARYLSLPGTNAPPLSPLSPQQNHSQNFDNPLYMLAPRADNYHEETEEFGPLRSSSALSLSLSQLSFDTPDERLTYLFSNFDERKVVSQGIQQRQLLLLRDMAQIMEAGVLVLGDATGREVRSYQPEDFLLSEPKQIGDNVVYSVHSPKLPGRVLALKVHKHTDDAPSVPTKNQPSHVNVQDVIASFPSPPRPSESDCSDAKQPGGCSSECANDLMKVNLPTVQSLLLRGHAVSVNRDLPGATLEDFIEDSSLLQIADCFVYDRQVCFLLLQILIGSHHLYHICASAAELRPQGIFLVWPSKETAGANGEGRDKSNQKMESGKTEKKSRIQTLWMTHGSPRVVLTPLSSVPPTFIKSQIGELIQYCLGPQESSTSLSSATTLSPYRRGLLHLASLLTHENSRPQMADMVTMLQVLLWGPGVPLFNRRSSTTTAHNWLTLKRALLVMKLAERGLIQDQSTLDWEDCVCMQYLSFADPDTVASVSSQLCLTLDVD